LKAIDRKAHHISVFTLELPQKIHRAVPMGGDYLGNADRTKREGPSFTAPDARILAVDDNAENLQVFRFLLKRTLVQVDTVTSGADCLEAVRKKTYHAIFMDYMMPGMDGIETFRRLRAFEAESNCMEFTQQTPVLVSPRTPCGERGSVFWTRVSARILPSRLYGVIWKIVSWNSFRRN
jgi:CheY-like chemotaxis protein